MNVYDGGLDAAAKKLMIETLTNAIAETIDLPKDRMRPIYVVIRDVPAINWGSSAKSSPSRTFWLPTQTGSPSSLVCLRPEPCAHRGVFERSVAWHVTLNGCERSSKQQKSLQRFAYA